MAAMLLWLSAAATATPQDFDFDLPAQRLDAALTDWSRITGVQLVYAAEMVADATAPSLQGRHSADAALTILLEGSDLAFRYSAAQTITLERALEPAAAAPRTLGVVHVTGAQAVKGANGSRDPLATEDSGSYAHFAAAVASPFPQPLKDTPRSVAVLTQQRIKDQNIVELAEALRQLPGVTVSGLPLDATGAFVRGFRVRDVQLDGGAPLLVSNDILRGDLSAYDRIELLRGSDGLGNGYVSPAGIVNLARKRPLDRPQVIAEAYGGSFDHYGGLVDASSPLGWGGRLRGRAVVGGVDKQYFYDTADLNRIGSYAIVEADPWLGALFAVGGRYVDEDRTPWDSGGLPFGSDDRQLGLPRNTSFILPWESERQRARQLFATLEQRFGPNWSARLAYDRLREDVDTRKASFFGAVDRQTGDGMTLGFPTVIESQRVQELADLKLRYRFDWLGHEQNLALGFNRATDRGDATSFRTDQDGFSDVNIYSFSPQDYPKPAITGENASGVSRLYRAGTTATLLLRPLAPLQVIGSWRWNRYESRSRTEGFDGEEFKDEYSAPSYLGLSWALLPRWSAYTSWADVYQTNSGVVTARGRTPEPTIGDNYEAGVKYASADESLQAALAVYRIKRSNFVEFIGTSEDPRCCFENNDDYRIVSEGVELELAGAPLSGWQLAASYAYNINRFAGPATPSPGSRFNKETPRHLFKLWTNWRPAAMPWNRLELGGGAYAQSKAEYVPVEVFDENGVPQDVIEVPQGGYAVFSARLAWWLDARWQVSLKGDNLFDRVYYANQERSAGNLYGEPRSWMLVVRGTY